MYRPFLLSIALSGVGLASVGADQTPTDVSTWRWNVSVILDAQRASTGVGATPAETFAQRYQRYSVLGQPEATHEADHR